MPGIPQPDIVMHPAPAPAEDLPACNRELPTCARQRRHPRPGLQDRISAAGEHYCNGASHKERRSI